MSPCCWCQSEISAHCQHQDYAILIADKGVCSHSACFRCLCSNLATKLATKSVQCPICNTAISEHIEKRNGYADKRVIYALPLPRNCYTNPSKEKDPYRYFARNQEDQIGKVLVYFAYTKKDLLLTATAVMEKNGEFQDDKSREAVIEYARVLGRAFFNDGRGVCTGVNAYDLQSLEKYAIEMCTNPGFRFFCDFANDLPLDMLRKDVNKLTAFDRSDILSCFVAHSMIQQVISNQKSKRVKKPSEMQETIGTTLYSLGCKKKVFEALSKWRISASISHLKRADAAGNADYLDHVFLATPRPFDFVVPCHDNLEFHWPNCGMKEPGVTKKDHVQSWTVQTFKVVRAEDPILKPCYDGRLSSDATTLDEIIERNEDAYTEIFGIRTDDYKKLGFYRLKHIDYFISHPFPKVEDCERLRFTRLRNPPMRNMGIDVQAQKRRDVNCRKIDFKLRGYDPKSNHNDYEEIDRQHHNLLDRNGIIVDIPLKIGLGETKTVLSYFKQYLSICDSQMRASELLSPVTDKIPLSSKYCFYVADGSPIYASHTLKDGQKKEKNTQFDPIRPFPGAFHYTKEVILLKSKLLEEFEREYIKLYRPSKDAQEAVLKPKDPREFQNEAVPYVAAKYRSVIEEYAIFSGKSEFSAAEVDQYMLEEAKKKWYCHLERDDLTLHEIYFMFRDSIKANDSELFFSAVRLSLPMCFVTNAYRYLRIGFELLLWRATASEEEVYLFEELAFTRQTEFGEFMAVDLCQEKVNKFFRDKLGHKVLSQHERKMVNRAIELNANATKPTEKKPIPPRFNEKPAHRGWEEVYTSIRQNLHEKRAWKRNSPVRFFVKGEWIDVEENCVTAPSGKLMTSEVMGWLKRGTDQCIDYYSSFYEVPRLRHQVIRCKNREKGGVPTTKIISTEDEYRNWSEKMIALKTSLDKKALRKAADGTKAKVKNAIEYTLSLMDDHDVDLNSLPDSLEGLITELVKIRQRWVADELANKGVSQQELQQNIAARERRHHAFTSKKKREELIDKTEFFYVTHPDVSSKFQAKRKLKFCESTD